MLAARAEGIGSTMTGMLQSYYANEVMDILGICAQLFEPSVVALRFHANTAERLDGLGGLFLG